MRARSRVSAVAAICLSVASVGAAAAQAAGGDGQLVVLDSGLTPAERALFYHVPLGSEILPVAWLRALQDPQTGKPFLDGVDRFGVLPDPGHPDGLPIGFAEEAPDDARFDSAMFGFSCALCHVSELHYQGRRVRIDGAPSLVHMESLVAALGEALKATVTSPKALWAFTKRSVTAQVTPDQLRARGEDLEALALEYPDLTAMASGSGMAPSLAAALAQAHASVQAAKFTYDPHAEGGEEVDHSHRRLVDRFKGEVGKGQAALGQWADAIRSVRERRTFIKRMRQAANFPTTDPGPGRNDDWSLARNVVFGSEDWIAPEAPASFPDLWGYNDADWLTWNGATTSGMERGVATVIGLLAFFDPETHSNTVSIEGLVTADELALKIQPPKWPEAVFGVIDQGGAERGRAIYQSACARCHDAPGETPLEEIGTDPFHALSYLNPLQSDLPFWAGFSKEMSAYKQAAYEDQGIGPERAARIEAMAPDKWRSAYVYVSRPLAGVWATAPYLHNGSVPTLDDLLKPPAERPARFPVGHRDYDVERLGFTAGAPEGTWMFDVSRPGNSNAGHEYGTDLSAADRAALLEYIKSL
jgi:hypothetical protein